MKKLLLPLLIAAMALCTTQAVQAQSNIGFRTGLNFATFVDRPSNTSVDSRTGLLVGTYFNFKLVSIPVWIQTEGLYTQKGFESGDATLKMDYLEVPVLVKVNFGSGRFQPHVYGGPYFGFPINSEITGNNLTLQVNNPETDIGVVLGAGTDITVGLTKINIGARYSFGRDDAIQDTPGKNSVISIVAGINL